MSLEDIIILDEDLVFKKNPNSVRETDVRYVSGNLNDVDSHFIDLSYNFDLKLLEIYSIFNGLDEFRIPNLTKKVVCGFESFLDVNSISFVSLSESKTTKLLTNYEHYLFNLKNLPNFDKSPFLRVLGEFGYTNIVTNLANDCESCISDESKFVMGYRN